MISSSKKIDLNFSFHCSGTLLAWVQGCSCTPDFRKVDIAPTDFEDIDFVAFSFCENIYFLQYLGPNFRICTHSLEVLKRALSLKE